MINITRRDVAATYLGYFLRLTSSLLVLPVVLNRLPAHEYGLWTVFLSVGAFTTMLDLGFGPVIVRYTTYAFCGARELTTSGLPDVDEAGAPNMPLLFTIMLTSRRIYWTISTISALLMGAASVYLVWIASSSMSPVTVLGAWIPYAAGVSFSVYYSYLNNVYKGLGRIRELQTANIVNQLTYIALQLLLLYAGLGIIGLAAANLAVSLLYRFQLGHRINVLASEHRGAYTVAKREMHDRFSGTYQAIRHNSRGVGLVLIANYLQSQGSTLLLSMFLSLEAVASYGVTSQLIGVVATVAAVPFATYLPKMSSLRLAGDDERLKDTFSVTTVFSYVTFLMGGAALLLLGRFALTLVGSNTSMLTTPQAAVLFMGVFLVTNHQRSTNYISLGNRQPYVRAYVVSSLVSLGLSATALWLGYGVWGVVVSNLVVQAAYNGWKWPHEALKETSLAFPDMVKRVFSMARVKLFGARA